MALKAGRPTENTRQRVERAMAKAKSTDEVRLNVIFNREEYKKLKRFALDRDMTVSDVVRESIYEYMSKYPYK